MENAQRKQHPQVLIERLNSVMLIMNYFPLSYISTVLIQIYMYSNLPRPHHHHQIKSYSHSTNVFLCVCVTMFKHLTHESSTM